jgi:hypothetical protein
MPFDIFEAWKRGMSSVQNIITFHPPDMFRYCAACGKNLKTDTGPERFTVYNKPDTWLCWSCHYDYKKFAADERIEIFYRLMKGE